MLHFQPTTWRLHFHNGFSFPSNGKPGKRGEGKTQEKILVSSEEREIGSLGKVAAASFFVEPSLWEFAAAAVCGTFHCKKPLSGFLKNI